MENPTITDIIPHRPPFLFIDEVDHLSQDRIVTRKHIDPAADFLKGHYPGNPVMPGVLLCECCFQAGALLLGHRLGRERAFGGTPVITRIREAKFKKVVRPGDVLDVEVVLDEEINDVFFMTGRAQVAGATALRVGFAATLIAGDTP